MILVAVFLFLSEKNKIKILMELNCIFRSKRVIVVVLAAIFIRLANQGKFLLELWQIQSVAQDVDP